MNQIQIPVAELKPALQGFSKVVSKHSTLPELGHLLLRANENSITLTATNLDDFVSFRMQSESGLARIERLIPFEPLHKIVRGCSREDSVTIEFTGNEARVSYPFAGKLITHPLITLESNGLPDIPNCADSQEVQVDDRFKRALLNALECVSDDCSRPVLQNVCLDLRQPKAHYVVGCDGRHLFAANSFKLGFKESVLIPSRRFITWTGFADDGDWSISIFTVKTAKYVSIKSARWLITSRQHEGEYPNWKQVLPHDSEIMARIQFDPESMKLAASALKRLPCENDNQTVTLIAAPDSPLILRSTHEEGSPSVPINGALATGHHVQVTVKREHLKRALDFELSQWRLHTGLQPIICSNGASQMVIMPFSTGNPQQAPRSNPTPAAPIQRSSPGAASHPPEEQQPREEVKTHNRIEQNPATTLEESAVTTAMDQLKLQVENARDNLRGVISNLNEALRLIAQAQRERRASEKEIEEVREALHSVQKIRI